MTHPSGPYGYGYAPPPPPPKPGVIPLAPMGLSQILTGAFAAIGRYWKPLLGVAAAAFGAALLVLAAAGGIAYTVVADHLPGVFDLPSGQDPSWEDGRPLLIAFGCVWLIAMIGMVVASALVYAACPAVLQEAVLGRRTTFGAVWRRAWSRTPAVLGTVFLTMLLTVPVPLIVFVGTFAGLLVALSGSGPVALVVLSFGGAVLATLLTAPLAAWLWVKFSLAPSAAVLEGQGTMAAMRRSSELVRGSWWRIFGCTLAAGAIAAAVNWGLQQVLSLLLSAPLSFSEDASPESTGEYLLLLVPVLVIAVIGSLVGQFVSSVFPPLVTGLLYIDQRIRKENLAPALAEAAEAAAETPSFSR
ncbi:oxidoreductase [Streptomyces sp. NPDC003035]|uniref:oxidoreductase n=1 Tax=Streptomyces sp. NPDC003035 TaxID=3364676 RepID=UPI0036A06E00